MIEILSVSDGLVTVKTNEKGDLKPLADLFEVMGSGEGEQLLKLCLPSGCEVIPYHKETFHRMKRRRSIMYSK